MLQVCGSLPWTLTVKITYTEQCLILVKSATETRGQTNKQHWKLVASEPVRNLFWVRRHQSQVALVICFAASSVTEPLTWSSDVQIDPYIYLQPKLHPVHQSKVIHSGRSEGSILSRGCDRMRMNWLCLRMKQFILSSLTGITSGLQFCTLLIG